MIHSYLCSQAPGIYVTDTRLIMSVYLSYYVYIWVMRKGVQDKGYTFKSIFTEAITANYVFNLKV